MSSEVDAGAVVALWRYPVKSMLGEELAAVRGDRDMEGLEHRDAVTDFALPAGTFFDGATVHVLTTAPSRAPARAA